MPGEPTHHDRKYSSLLNPSAHLNINVALHTSPHLNSHNDAPYGSPGTWKPSMPV